MTSAVVYTRISKDRVGAGLGVERQRDDCYRLAEQLGWTIVSVYSDNDISAYSGKPRPEYRAMLDALDRGEAQAVLAWHTDRLHRSPSELEEFISLCERRAVTVRTVQAGELDLSTPAGQMTARIVGAVARHEIDHARSRMKSAHAQAAVMGRAHGKVAYGYRMESNGQRVPDEKTAPIVQELAKRVLSGESIYSICCDLNEREVPTPHSAARWASSRVSRLLMSPTYAGMRTHLGTLTQASWEPLIDPEDHRVICSLLKDPRRKTTRGSAPVHLLSGIAKCGVCGDLLWRKKSHGQHSYACVHNFCVSRRMEPVDLLVSEAIIARCEQMTGVQDLVDDDAAEAGREAARLRAQLDEFCDKAAAGELTASSLARIEAKMLPKIRAAEAAATAVVQPAVGELLGVNARARWEQMPIASKRAVIRSLVEVTIDPGVSGPRFRPELVRLTWL